jgi:hypothetical protein
MTPLPRIAGVVALALLLLAGTAGAGHAKGPSEVTVSGPGIADLHLTYTERTDDVDVIRLGDATRIHDMWSPGQLGQAPNLTPEELGPRYVLTWHAGDERVVQHVYPFADGRGWARILPGQRLWENPVSSGWRTGAPGMTPLFVDLGATVPRPPGRPSERSERSAEGASLTTYAVAAPVAVLLAGGLLAGGLLARRRARRPTDR